MRELYLLKNIQPGDEGKAWPELLSYFAVLYNLSMLVRYEGDWWGEMEQMRDREDFVFIVHFLQSAVDQVPALISTWLKDRHLSIQ